MKGNLSQLRLVLSQLESLMLAKDRNANGWTYGENRDDTLKTHPHLIPYLKLSKSEKDNYRNTALETLKVMQTLGYDKTVS
jgi:hypothetical protein